MVEDFCEGGLMKMKSLKKEAKKSI